MLMISINVSPVVQSMKGFLYTAEFTLHQPKSLSGFARL